MKTVKTAGSSCKCGSPGEEFNNFRGKCGFSPYLTVAHDRPGLSAGNGSSGGQAPPRTRRVKLRAELYSSRVDRDIICLVRRCLYANKKGGALHSPFFIDPKGYQITVFNCMTCSRDGPQQAIFTEPCISSSIRFRYFCACLGRSLNRLTSVIGTPHPGISS